MAWSHGAAHVHPCLTPRPAAAALQDHPEIVVDETYEVPEDATEPVAGEPTKVWGNLVAFVERLDDELFKSLQVGAGLAAAVACA